MKCVRKHLFGLNNPQHKHIVQTHTKKKIKKKTQLHLLTKQIKPSDLHRCRHSYMLLEQLNTEALMSYTLTPSTTPFKSYREINSATS